jgi:hypothetical protein
MQITEITVSYGRTQSLEAYCNVRPSVTLRATLDEGEDPEAARQQLLDEARAIVYEEVDQALEDDGKAAKYSTEPRYRLYISGESMWVGRDRWGSRTTKVDAPERLLVLLPNDKRLDAGDAPTWWNRPYGASSKLRMAHARRCIDEYLKEHPEFRLIDCADGDLSRIPQWAMSPPPEPEPEPEPQPAYAAERGDDWEEGDDDGE